MCVCVCEVFLNLAFNALTQYHGGTNFGREASAFVTASYYDDAPLDEYGMRTFFYTYFPFCLYCFLFSKLILTNHLVTLRYDQSTKMGPFEGVACCN